MPTYILEGHAEVEFAPGPLSISITMENTKVAPELRVKASETGPDVAVHPRPGLIVLPKVEAVLTVRVVPVGANRFPESAVANVNVVVNDGRGSDPQRAVLIPIDLAGLSSRDLLVLEPSNSGVIVRSARVIPPPPDHGPLGNAARISATEILGVQAVDSSAAINLVVAVDQSGSFRACVDDGMLAAVLDVLAGIGDVIAPAMPLGAAIVGSEVSWIPVSGTGALTDVLVLGRAQAALSTGFRSGAPDLLGFSPTGNTVTFLITDGLPADLDALNGANTVDGEGPHLVVLGQRAIWAAQTMPSCPVTFIEPLDAIGATLADRLINDRALLATAVKSMLAGCFAPGTTAYERVGA